MSLFVAGLPILGRACDCRMEPVCAYIGADIIFLGRVSFTNDDGSGSFNQATLVRFDVEESFKGVPSDSHQIWVDPGSFTSCYKEYTLGERYLIFAGNSRFPPTTASMTVIRDSSGKAKPVPEGFDPAKHAVYYAPECYGSRTTRDFPGLAAQDLAELRAYRAGRQMPRIVGHVSLYPFLGWPVFSGPKLRGAQVILSNDVTRLEATTDSVGNFSLAEAPVGYYHAWAALPPYRTDGQVILHVPEAGCGFANIQLATTTRLQGIVLDPEGRPVPKMPVRLQLKGRDPEEANRYALRATTDKDGRFVITGLPDEDLYLSAGDEFPTSDMPYGRVYYPNGRSPQSAAVIRLKPGDQAPPIILRLEKPLARLTVSLRVVNQQGEPVANARVNALNGDGAIAELAKTDSRGVAKLPCLAGLKYQLEAQTLHQRMPWTDDILKSSRSVFTCGVRSMPSTLVLDHSAKY